MDDTARLVATVLIASFVIERIVAALTFLAETPKGPARRHAIYRFLVAAVLAILAVTLADIRILARLGVRTTLWADYALGWLVLVGGAEHIRDFVGSGGGSAKKETPAIQFLIEQKDGTVTAQSYNPAG